MREVADRVYGEMAAAGYGAVGEFHYVHHRPDGTPYEDAERDGDRASPRRAPRPGCGSSCSPPPTTAAGEPRFRDASVDAFLARVDALRAWPASRASASPRTASAPCRRTGCARSPPTPTTHGLVRHIHAHEQPRELEECRAEHGCSPIELLERTGFLSDRTTVVHAIHVDARDVGLLAASAAIVATCPTTEGNLGDGHFPALVYRDAGVRLAIGSDSNVVVDPFEEVRELETGARRDAPHPPRAAGRRRRPVGRAVPERAGEPRARRRRQRDGRPRPSAAARRPGRRRHARARDLRKRRRRTVARVTERRLISSGSTFEAQIGYSRAVVDGDWVFVVRHDRLRLRDDDDLRRRRRAGRAGLANVGAALEEAGCSFADVVRVHYLLPDRADFEPCWPVLRRCFGEARPAATMMECGLLDPRARIEIEVTARRRA